MRHKRRLTELPAFQVFERRFSYQELIRKYTESPVIDLLVVILTFNHFRREVIQSSAQSLPAQSWCVYRPTEVSNLEFPVDANQYVFWLYIAYDGISVVRVYT